MPRDIEKGLRAGFFGYLTKPIRLDEFLHALDGALAYAAAQPARPALRPTPAVVAAAPVAPAATALTEYPA
jgi:DNA-binding response OmpR family regulator